MNDTKKQIKALISGIMVDDDNKVNTIVKELSESIIPNREADIMNIILESFKEDSHV